MMLYVKKTLLPQHCQKAIAILPANQHISIDQTRGTVVFVAIKINEK